MSLIDEALKRARQEAARQDEAARELRYRQVPVIPGLRQPARRSWLLPAVIGACLLAGIGIGLGLSLVRGGGEDQRASVPPPAAAPVPAPARVEETPAVPAPPAAASLEEAEPPVVEEESEAPVAAAPPAAPVQESAPPAPEPVPAREEAPVITEMRQREIALNPAPRPPSAPEARESEPAPVPAAPAPAPAEPEPVATVEVTETGQVRTYQQELPLAGGGTLRLNGIAFTEQPVALFGDKVVAAGESVAGYKVVAIEARRVRLEGQGGVVVVELP